MDKSINGDKTYSLTHRRDLVAASIDYQRSGAVQDPSG
jgi:hypothetical protein